MIWNDIDLIFLDVLNKIRENNGFVYWFKRHLII